MIRPYLSRPLFSNNNRVISEIFCCFFFVFSTVSLHHRLLPAFHKYDIRVVYQTSYYLALISTVFTVKIVSSGDSGLLIWAFTIPGWRRFFLIKGDGWVGRGGSDAAVWRCCAVFRYQPRLYSLVITAQIDYRYSSFGAATARRCCCCCCFSLQGRLAASTPADSPLPANPKFGCAVDNLWWSLWVIFCFLICCYTYSYLLSLLLLALATTCFSYQLTLFATLSFPLNI